MMKKLRGFVLLGLAVAFGAGLMTLTADSEAAPPDRAKKVQLVCKPGWRGTAVGEYGGVGFGLSCDNGRATTRLTGTVGTAYSVRMGVESQSSAFDCFFTGDSRIVNETCADVRLTIR